MGWVGLGGPPNHVKKYVCYSVGKEESLVDFKQYQTWEKMTQVTFWKKDQRWARVRAG